MSDHNLRQVLHAIDAAKKGAESAHTALLQDRPGAAETELVAILRAPRATPPVGHAARSTSCGSEVPSEAGNCPQCAEDASSLVVEADEQIEGGTSGGPVVNELGELVGIVSHSSQETDESRKSRGSIPRPHLALPAWVLQKMARSEGNTYS